MNVESKISLSSIYCVLNCVLQNSGSKELKTQSGDLSSTLPLPVLGLVVVVVAATATLLIEYLPCAESEVKKIFPDTDCFRTPLRTCICK